MEQGSDSTYMRSLLIVLSVSLSDVAALNAVVLTVPAVVLLFALVFVIVMVCKHKGHKRKGTKV